jgi:predicted permease
MSRTSWLVVATLALALGAVTAVISVADALILRAVPFPDANRLVLVSSAFPRLRLTNMGLSGPEALELGELTRGFEAVGPLAFTAVTMQAGTDAVQAPAIEISRGALDALGLRPAVGRTFTAAEFQPGREPVVMISSRLWRRAFGGDASIFERGILAAGVATRVVGVVPEGVHLMNRTLDVWLPLTITRDTAGGRADHRFTIVGRVAKEGGLEGARADLARAVAAWREETGEFHSPAPLFHPLSLTPLRAATTGLTSAPITALVGAVAFVLLLACANIVNLLVARADRQRGDIATRVALGATRARLLRDYTIHGLVLAGAGSLAGAGVAHALLAAVRAIWPAADGGAGLALDVRVLALGASVAIAVGVTIGAAPVLHLDIPRAHQWLQAGGRSAIDRTGRMRLRELLIATQIGVAVLLSSGAGLMIRSLAALMAVDSGFDASGVLRAEIALPEGSYTADASILAFYDRVLERTGGLPGVSQAALVSGLPPLRRANNTSFVVDGAETFGHGAMFQVDFIQHATRQSFDALRIPLTRGRIFTDADNEAAAPVAIVNETLARRFWPGEDAIGRRLRPLIAGTPWFVVIGVTRDVKQAGLQAPAGSELYVPYRQSRLLLPGWLPRSMNLLLRSPSGDVTSLAPAIRREIRAIDPTAAVTGVAPLRDLIDLTIAQPRLLAWLLGAFAALALVIAAVGVYAVTSCAMGTRTAEFGVRMALGATPGNVGRLVVRDSAGPLAAGVLIGCASAIACARVMKGLVFGVAPVDPLSLVAGASLIALAALLATLVPAVRAARVDPLVALRNS